jgi:Abortive infection alpha
MSEAYDLAKAGFDAAMAPMADLIEKIAGPAAEEIGLTLRDSVKFYRARRRLRLLQRTKEMFDELGVEPRPVPFKLLLPIIENGSNEEDDELQDRWAALLVSSSGDGASMPGAPDILRQLTKEDVLLLQLAYDYIRELVATAASQQQHLNVPGIDLNSVVEDWKHAIEKKFGHAYLEGRAGPQPVWDLTLDNVARLGLISRGRDWYFMSNLGYHFIGLCQYSSWTTHSKI